MQVYWDNNIMIKYEVLINDKKTCTIEVPNYYDSSEVIDLVIRTSYGIGIEPRGARREIRENRGSISYKNLHLIEVPHS